ncbi:MAG: ABC transporter ATP-binding protein [Deltaproteobacteria bacterium]|nr:ABC transporter ATP-binding protein [Deltaproteobacteria bacterium]MBW2070907.1 ABC transporter ATP-binding protein [Deltaproteobacteria bacterium]
MNNDSAINEQGVALKVEKLAKRYGDLVALDGVSFHVRRGEIFAYLGPNGAGKTTTVNILSGLLGRDGGKVMICGYDLDRDPIRVKEIIGVVPDESNLYPELSCKRNLEYLGELYGISRVKRQLQREKLLTMFGLQDKATVPFQGLSKGLKRRLTIAAALVHEPEILFLDEPTTGLDVPSARYLRQLLMEINGNGTTVLLTTHNMFEADELAHRLGILIKGRLVTTGTPEEIRKLAEQRERLEVVFSQKVGARELLQNCTAVTGVVMKDNTAILAVANLDEALRQIVTYAGAHGVKIVNVVSMPPSLEEAFLSLLQSHQEVA